MKKQKLDKIESLLHVPASDVVDAFYKDKVPSCIQVQSDVGNGRGKGVIATKIITAGDKILVERPLVAMQHTGHGNDNRPFALVCNQCFKFIGSINMQLGNYVASGASESVAVEPEQLADLEMLQNVPLAADYTLPKVVHCTGGCYDAAFCSQTCAETAWSGWHKLMCAGEHTEAIGDGCRELQEFYNFSNEHTDSFILSGQLICKLLLDAEIELGKKSSTGSEINVEDRWQALKAAWLPVAMGHKALNWDIPQHASSDSDSEEEGERDEHDEKKEEHKHRNHHHHHHHHSDGEHHSCCEEEEDVKTITTKAYELFTAAVTARAPTLTSTFPELLSDATIWSSILGMFLLNNLSVYIHSPVRQWAAQLKASDSTIDWSAVTLPRDGAENQAHHLAQMLQTLVDSDELVDEEGTVWACHGNAFYSIQSCMNHSCSPNARAWKDEEQDTDGCAVIVAVRDIQPGEEITISYIDETKSVEARQNELAEYLFTCACDKCTAEARVA